jgi:hypothetical protein
MKKIILGIFLIFIAVEAYSQQGLDGIIVEKYYVGNAADHAADNSLATGAVTYRIYVDMKDGWQLQSVYANPVKNQRMAFQTSATAFFNDVNGATYGSDITYLNLKNGLPMLDSYLSLGAAAKKAGSPSNYYFGIPKADDDAVNTITHTDGLIQNTDPKAGIPVRDRDGIITVTVPAYPAPSATSTLDPLLAMLDGSAPGNNFTTTDGAYFTSSNCVGPNTGNKVLIGQFTTDGTFTFRLNVQIRRISDFVVENYVNENPGAGEFLRTDLAQTLGQPATPPSVTGLAVNPGTVIFGDVVNLSVTATDNVSVSKVEFFRGTTSLGVSTSTGNPYVLAWTSDAIGSFNITAVATDDEGSTTTSSPAVALTVNPVPANIPPVVTALTVPATANVSSTINGSATATDSDGTIANIEFFVNGVSVGVDNSSPYQFSFTAPATDQVLTVKAVATDNKGGKSADRTATISISDPAGPPYQITSQSVSCANSDFFYVPVITRPGAAAISNIIGFDMVMSFNPAKVRPTGRIRVNRDLISDSTFTTYALRIKDDSLFISLSLNGSAPEGTFFHGTGKVLRVEFAKSPAFLPTETVTFKVRNFVESYNTGTSGRLVKDGTFATYTDHLFTGSLKFWADNSPVTYTGDPLTSLITNISGNVNSVPKVQPDAVKGEFIYDINNGLSINIDRNIADATDVMAAINGYDAYLTQKVLLEDPTFVPNVFQIMAMDVNRDSKISAGDVSQINQRTAKKINEFKQTWNYNDDGTKRPGMGASLDWEFLDNRGLVSYTSCVISTVFPKDDNKGYSRNRVPIFPVLLALPVTDASSCPIIMPEDYIGIMIGDVNGNYKNILPGEKPGLKSTTIGKGLVEDKVDKVVFDLSKATVSDGILTFPISVSSKTNINALDFSMKFDESKLTFKSVTSFSSNMQSLAYYNEQDQTLRFTSFSMQNYSNDAPVVAVRFELRSGTITNDDLKSIQAYLNGDLAKVELSKLTLNKEIPGRVIIYPNPARTILNVEVAENAAIELLDMNGKSIRIIQNVNAYEKQVINVENLPQGVYFMKIRMKIGSDVFVATRKVVIKK